jgi:GT2 family glycosyltransferase
VLDATDKTIPVLPSGKFLIRGGAKFFLKAIRFEGPSSRLTFEDKIALRKRLGDIHAAHATAVVVGDNQEALLELVAGPGLHAIVEIKVQPENLFSRRAYRSAIADLGQRVTNLRSYPAVISYLLDCPVDPDELRARGLQMVRTRLARMVAAVREADPHRMVGVKHRAGTIGVASRDEDFIYAVMSPLTLSELRRLATRVHNLAGDRPLLLEFARPTPAQDELIAYGFALGAAGVAVQGAVDYRSLNPRERASLSMKMLQASELLPFLALNGTCPPQPPRTPKVSVVICAYNAERTMRKCLESLRRLDYPNFEVIIVDDGSRDATAQIAADFAEFRLIRQPNKGLSVARNVGMQAALGELVAYTDSDCVVDPHWLTFMVRAMVEERLDGCGGPNYAPHEDGWLEGCVAASPGAPCHVLIGDDRAEHLAGCNMLFRKAALEDVGGFDPQFTAAGDDVDICWRLMNAGYALGYCPAAFVWHFRRNTVKAYYGQQRGYGRAEAMLYLKYPQRFNPLGQIRWNGTIPGIRRTLPGGDRLRVSWVRTAQQMQRVDEPPLSLLAVAPMTAEWSLAATALVVLSLLLGVTIWPAVVLLAAGPLWAAHYALKAPLEKCHRGAGSRMLIGWLAFSGSLVRTIARYRWRADARRRALFDNGVRQQATFDWKLRQIRLSYWNSAYTTREAVLQQLQRFFGSRGRAVVADSGWEDFDLLVEANPCARIQFRTAEEELGGLELKTNVAARLRLSIGARLGLGACLIAAATAWLFGSALAATALCIPAAVIAVGAMGGLADGARLAYLAIEQCAAELKLVPLGKPVTAVAAPSIPATADAEGSAEAAQPAGR